MVELPLPVSQRAGGLNRDYATIFADLRRLVPQYTPEWTYVGDDDLGVVLLQLFAYLADNLHYAADAAIRDTSIAEAINREYIRQKAEWLGYFARRPEAATVVLTFTLDAAQAEAVVIPKGTQVSTSSLSPAVYFETASELIISAGNLTGSVAAAEGTTETVGLGVATGDAFEAFQIPHQDVLFNQSSADLLVFVDGVGLTFTKWPALAGPNELVYWVRQNEEGYLEILFGNGIYGQRINAEAVVTATYRRGGGTVGRVSAAAVDRVDDTISLNDGSPVTLSVTNAESSYGASAQETIDSIRFQAPAFFTTQNRAVTLDDYDTHANAVAGVHQAKSIRKGVNGVVIYVVPDNAFSGQSLTGELRAAVLAVVDAIKMATDAVSIQPAVLVPIDITMTGHAYSYVRNDQLKRRMLDVLIGGSNGLIHVGVNQLGQHLRMSDFIGAIEDVEGLDYVDTYKFSRQPQVEWLYRTGDATSAFTPVVTTETTYDEVWTIYFTDVNEFTVTGSVSGLQQNIGQLDVGYSDDLGRIQFKLETGANAMAEGDEARIRVSRPLWNIQLSAFEFPVAGEVVVATTGGIE